jgi:hypothetical protein
MPDSLQISQLGAKRLMAGQSAENLAQIHVYLEGARCLSMTLSLGKIPKASAMGGGEEEGEER